MAETLSIQQRIAALNLNQVGQSTKPQIAFKKPPPPPLPRSQSVDNEITRPEEDGNPSAPIGNMPEKGVPETQIPPPALPTRPELRRPPSQSAKAPSLPPRKASGLPISRRDSTDSISSIISNNSSISGPSTRTSATSSSRRPSLEPKSSSLRALAPSHDSATLPPLPPKKPDQKRPSITTTKSSIDASSAFRPGTVQPLPPSLPARRVLDPVERSSLNADRRQSIAAVDTRTEQPRKFALSYSLSKPTEAILPVPQNSDKSTAPDPNTPPIPMSSRPDLARLQASKPKPSTVSPRPAASMSCLKCRDFSGPDGHAARFPREAIPCTEVGWLAHQLTDPFPSTTDKARAIFTWLHHNIAYDCKAFFSRNIQPSTPAGTISSGLAVCEGYAGLFTALATHAGLESVVIGGHGKGFGHKALGPGEAVPSFNTNHAWNAVKIDDGEWKLIEPCWGAGYLDGTQQYTKHFSPEWFVVSNEEFGLRHFPKDRNMFFRTDGGTISWDEYMVGGEGRGEDATIFSGVVEKYGLSKTGFLPKKKHIKSRGAPPKQRIQFQFQKLCEHWNGERLGLGKPYVFVLNTGGKDGRKRDMIPFSTNGQFWWCDLAVEDLGCAGQTVNVYAVTVMNGQDARGLKPEEVGKWIGRRSMSFDGVASWQLV